MTVLQMMKDTIDISRYHRRTPAEARSNDGPCITCRIYIFSTAIMWLDCCIVNEIATPMITRIMRAVVSQLASCVPAWGQDVSQTLFYHAKASQEGELSLHRWEEVRLVRIKRLWRKYVALFSIRLRRAWLEGESRKGSYSLCCRPVWDLDDTRDCNNSFPMRWAQLLDKE
jgi:hypothetical protein